jgi:hypothetical protein
MKVMTCQQLGWAVWVRAPGDDRWPYLLELSVLLSRDAAQLRELSSASFPGVDGRYS